MGLCRVLLTVCAVALLSCSLSRAFAQSAYLHHTLIDDGTNLDTVTAADVPPIPNASTINAVDDAPALPQKPKVKPQAYNPPAIGDGPILFHSSLGVQGVYSTNAKMTSINPRPDFGLRLVPIVSFGSDWSRHEWHGLATGDLLTYADTPSANDYSGTIETGGRIDIRRDTFVDLDTSLSTDLLTEGDPNLPQTASGPARTWNFVASGGLQQDFGPVTTRVRLGALRNVYNDVPLSTGGVENNQDRNYWEPGVIVRGTFGYVGIPFRPFVEVSYDPRFHDVQPDRNGQYRNSQGAGVGIGVTIDDGPIWIGDISANFIARDYDDPALQTAMALGIDGSITWSPTPLWNIVASSAVTLDETEQVNVSATPTWHESLLASYAVRENVKIGGGVTVTITSNPTGLDTTTVASLGADWQLNPYLSISGSLQNTWFNAANGSGNYVEQRVMTGVILRH